MRIVVAHPAKTSADSFAEVFQKLGVLKRYVVWARTLPPWLDPKLVTASSFGAALRASGRILLPSRLGERWEFALYPLFGRWAARHVEPGDAVFSSFGYCNEGFAKARATGGLTLLNCGNSHPSTFWQIMTEEHRRWGVPGDPILRSQHERALEMVGLTDYFFCPSTFVRDSYRQHGVPEERLIVAARTFNPAIFKPAPEPHTRRTFRVVAPGGVSLRKGTLYLLAAFEKLRREFPDCELVLTRAVHDIGELIKPFEHLITWIDGLPHAELAKLFHESDVYVLPTLEEGLARTGIEAMACGVPVIVTPNSGVNDFVTDGVSGFVVPPRDSEAIFQKLLLLARDRDLRINMGRAAATAMEQVRPDQFARIVGNALAEVERRESSRKKEGKM